jgi:hypothetical protein
MTFEHNQAPEMPLFDDAPALRQLLTSYYHEDWTMDRRNYAEVVREFVESEPRELVSAATSELRVLLAKPVAEQALEDGLGEVGCYFYAPGAGLTARAWLTDVAELLEAAG